MKRTHKLVLLATGLGILFSIPAVISGLNVGAPAPTLAPVKPSAVQQKAEDMEYAQRLRATQAIGMLRTTMRNPDSFQPYSVIAMKDGSLCIGFRAQNGFGGMDKGLAVETPKGKITADADVYNHFCADKSGTELWGTRD
jgi:hypothetical protein